MRNRRGSRAADKDPRREELKELKRQMAETDKRTKELQREADQVQRRLREASTR